MSHDPSVVGFSTLPVKRRRALQRALTWTIAVALASTLQAQEPTVVKEEIVVSANRIPVPSDRVGSAVTVISEDDIERRGSLVLLDLLRTVPGVEVTQAGGAGKAATVRIRGGDASHTLVLIDGVRANSPTTGDFDWSNIKTDLIERVEILRGPQATYGSEAVSGVISIVTKRGEQGGRFEVSAEAGSEDLRELALRLDGRFGGLAYALSASDFETDGVSHRAVPLGQSEPDGYQNTTIAGRFVYSFHNDVELGLSVRSLEGDTELDGFFGEDFNATQKTDSLIAAANVELPLTQRWTQIFQLGVHDADLLGEDPDTFFNNYQINTKVEHLYSQSNWKLNDDNTLTLGLRSEEREAVNVGAFKEKVDIDSYYLQHQFSWRDRLHLTGAIRDDDHSQFGSETTWRLTAALVWPTQGTRIHSSYGTSFRAPDFNELYFPGAGDPNLAAETSTGYDLGIEQRFLDGKLTADLTYFDSDFDDLIAFDLVAFRFNNVLEATSSGVELALRYDPLDSLGFSFSHTYNDTEDLTTGLELARRPRGRTALGVDFEPHRRVRGTLTALSVRDRIDSNGAAMDDYERLDLSLRFEAMPSVQPYLRIENLFDEDYEEVPGFTTPGLVAAVGLTYRR